VVRLLLWHCRGKNGMVQGDLNSFGDYMYTQEAIRIISEHDVDIPLFYYVAFQCKYESSLTSATRTAHVTLWH
jgi:hypothetical protein